MEMYLLTPILIRLKIRQSDHIYWLPEIVLTLLEILFRYLG